MFRNICGENLKLHNFFENRTLYEIMWKNTVEPVKPQITIWRMHISYSIPKAKSTPSEHVIFITLARQR
jgi:hypothetical protein